VEQKPTLENGPRPYSGRVITEVAAACNRSVSTVRRVLNHNEGGERVRHDVAEALERLGHPPHPYALAPVLPRRGNT
jgi:hypothetical protein